MRLLPILLLLTILCSFTVFAEYQNVGSNDTVFNTDSGFYSSDSINDVTNSITITGQRGVPLVSNIDNIPGDEIIVLDGATLRLFQNKELDTVPGINSLTLNFSTNSISNIYVYDIDGDNKKEIIVANEPGNFNDAYIYIAEYNGSDFVLQDSHALNVLNQRTDGDIVLACRGIQDCALMYSDKQSRTGNDKGASSIGNVLVAFFNTSYVDSGDVIGTGGGSSAYCFPKIKVAVVGDCDNDLGDDEYLFSAGLIDSTTPSRWNEVHGFCVNMVGTTASLSHQNTITDIDGATGVLDSCQQNVGKLLTAPLLLDIDGSSGKETVIGYQKDEDQIKIHSFTPSGSFKDDYPEFWTAEGILVSNVMQMDAFPNGVGTDFCVMGYSDTNEEIDLLCGSEQDSIFYGIFPVGFNSETAEFKYSTDGQYNITQTYGTYNVIAHATEQKNNDYTEVVNSYGVFELNYNSFNGSSFVNSLDRLFENPTGDSVTIMADAEGVGRSDLITLSATNLYYVDDGYSNTGPVTCPDESCLSNPCLDTTIKVNESVAITVVGTDVDNDNIFYTLTAYAGTENEQVINSSTFLSSSQSGVISFQANQTIGSAILYIDTFDDNENSKDGNRITQSFSVANNGQEFGDQQCSFGLSVAEEQVEGQVNSTLLAVKDNNVGIQVLTYWDSVTGLGAFLGWLFLMVIIALIFFISPVVLGYDMKGHFPILIGFIVFIEFIMLMIGVGIGAVGVGGLITILTMALMGALVGVSKFLQGSSRSL